MKTLLETFILAQSLSAGSKVDFILGPELAQRYADLMTDAVVEYITNGEFSTKEINIMIDRLPVFNNNVKNSVKGKTYYYADWKNAKLTASVYEAHSHVITRSIF